MHKLADNRGPGRNPLDTSESKIEGVVGEAMKGDVDKETGPEAAEVDDQGTPWEYCVNAAPEHAKNAGCGFDKMRSIRTVLRASQFCRNLGKLTSGTYTA